MSIKSKEAKGSYTGAKLTSDSYSVADTFEGFDRPFQYIFDVLVGVIMLKIHLRPKLDNR